VGEHFVWACALPVVVFINLGAWLLARTGATTSSGGRFFNLIVWWIVWPFALAARFAIVPTIRHELREGEYRADQAAGRADPDLTEPLLSALRKLEQFEPARTGWEELLVATHPPTEFRIERLVLDRAERLARADGPKRPDNTINAPVSAPPEAPRGRQATPATPVPPPARESKMSAASTREPVSSHEATEPPGVRSRSPRHRLVPVTVAAIAVILLLAGGGLALSSILGGGTTPHHRASPPVAGIQASSPAASASGSATAPAPATSSTARGSVAPDVVTTVVRLVRQYRPVTAKLRAAIQGGATAASVQEISAVLRQRQRTLAQVEQLPDFPGRSDLLTGLMAAIGSDRAYLAYAKTGDRGNLVVGDAKSAHARMGKDAFRRRFNPVLKAAGQPPLGTF
jgi:hypothetical protein